MERGEFVEEKFASQNTIKFCQKFYSDGEYRK